MQCSDAEKVLLGTFFLKGDAQVWWEAKERVYWNMG